MRVTKRGATWYRFNYHNGTTQRKEVYPADDTVQNIIETMRDRTLGDITMALHGFIRGKQREHQHRYRLYHHHEIKGLVERFRRTLPEQGATEIPSPTHPTMKRVMFRYGAETFISLPLIAPLVAVSNEERAEMRISRYVRASVSS